MSENVYIIAGDILTCAGNLDETWSRLQSGSTALAAHRLEGFSQSWPIGMVKDLPDEGIGSERRQAALLDRLLDSLPPIHAQTPLLLATTKGAVDELRHGVPYHGQPWQIGRSFSRRLELDGECVTVSAACASSTIALIQAGLRIAAGECNQALVLGIDLVSRFVLGGFASLKSLSPTGCRPFDRHRDGLSLGEGGGWILLSNTPKPFNGCGPLCKISGWGIACDATHITAPCRHGSGLTAAVRQAVSESPGGIGGINAHGTGTVYNDAMECTAFSGLWSASPPICSVKGTIGHCLGAAGIIEATLSVKSLETGLLPPTTGLREPDDHAPPVSGKLPLPLRGPSILTCNSGFGGINAALLLSTFGQVFTGAAFDE